MARTPTTDLTSAEVNIIQALEPLGSPLQVIRVNAGWTALEYAALAWGGDALKSDPLSQFASTTSAQLAGVMSDETGSGSLVFGTDPTFTTRINTPEIKATSSSWVDIHNNSGTQIALFGAGGSTGATLVWTTNIGSASADYHQLTGGTGTITDTATGSSSNININLVPKGTGRVQEGGVNVSTISSTDTFTNKSISFGSNTVTTTKAQLDTAVTDGNIVYTDAIWVSVQAYDADLTTWAGITPWANVGTALAVAVGSAGAIVTNGWALGTPSSGTLTNTTGLPLAGVVGSTTEALGVGSLEVWHASDTTITRVSAWVIAVEGVTVPTETSTNTLTNKTLTTPTITKPVMSATNPTAQTYTPSASGTATLDLSLSNQHDITMPAGNITIALSNVTNNQIFLVSITQDGTGSRTVTWFSTIRWAGGSTPTLTTTANKRDMFGFKRTGANTYDGFIIWQNI